MSTDQIEDNASRYPAGTEIKPISDLRPYKRNARTHSRKQINKIARSIETFGFVNPVLIDENNQILAGHGRVAAAKELGMSSVPTLRIDHLSEEEKRAYILADNRLAEEAGWDKDMLAIELQGLMEVNFSIELTGFEVAEIDLLMDDQAAKEAPDVDPSDNIPDLPEDGEAVSQLGDLWQLGNHLLYCGDALESESYALLLGDTRAHFIFTDPPYNVPINGHVSGLGEIQHREFAMASGEMTPREFQAFLERTFHRLTAFSIVGSIHQICMDWRHSAEILAAGKEFYDELKNVCVWVKTNGGMGTFYRSRHEFVFVFKYGDAPHTNNFELGQHGRYRTNVWEYAGANSFSKSRADDLAMHPTVKPVALVADAIRDCSKHGQLVLDPFGGSGTTLIAAEKTGRKARLIEIDPAYCDTIIRRWQSFTGQRAKLAQCGSPFERIEEQRQSILEIAAPSATEPNRTLEPTE